MHLDVKPANLLIGDEGEGIAPQISAVELHELPSRRMGVVLPSLISAGIHKYILLLVVFLDLYKFGCYGQVRKCCASLASRPVCGGGLDAVDHGFVLLCCCRCFCILL